MKHDKYYWISMVTTALAVVFFVMLLGMHEGRQEDKKKLQEYETVTQYQQTDEATEIYPCPFCGSEDVEVRDAAVGGSHYVRCNDCYSAGPMYLPGGSMTDESNIFTEEQAIQWWNHNARL